jgi:inner membrane protein
VDLLTNGLTSLAAARAVKKWLPRWGEAIVVVAGVAPDLDYASEWGGAGSFLRLHRGALHGLASASLLACSVAAVAFLVSRRFSAKDPSQSLSFASALAASVLGVATHLLLDFFSGPGVMFLWPWNSKWWGREIVRDFDPWLLALLIAGILLPTLFGMVGDEIGERRKSPRGRIAAIVTLVILTAYFGFRAELRARAIHLLMSNEFHGRAPFAAGAFPLSGNPFEWRGAVSTESTIEVVSVPANEADFDPDRGVTYYKPTDSPALEVAEKTSAAQSFLEFARFPVAIMQRMQSGSLIEFCDMRFAPSDPTPDNMVALIDLNEGLQIQEERIRFARERR